MASLGLPVPTLWGVPKKRPPIIINLCDEEAPVTPPKKKHRAPPVQKAGRRVAYFPHYEDWDPRVPYGWDAKGKPRTVRPNIALCAFDSDRDIF